MVFPDDIVKFWPRDIAWSGVEYLDLGGLRKTVHPFYSFHSPNTVSMKMRRIPICSEVEVIEMSSNQNLEVCQESRIERMKKLLSSPLTKKKSSIQGKMFGSSLDALAHREPHPQHEVPFIITRICQYIEKHGMSHEGIFRISGNARLIEKLKSSFDHSGDAPLESEGDVASAGALLKLFLRELPEPVIPSAAQAAFLEAARENFQNKDNCVRVLKCLVHHLPEEHFAVLKYLIHFLHRIAELEDQNRMSASSLGIVFGPNLFRVSDDFSGLKDQAVTNHIATTFIKNYEAIFEDNSNELPPDEDLRSPRIDPKEYEPLSVVIPPVDDTVLAMQAQETIQSEKRVPVLMVDSFCDSGKRGSIDGRLNGDGSVSNCTPPRRKRKERKFSGDDISGPLRSSSEERPSMDQNEEQKFYLGGERIRRCSSHDEMRNIDETQPVEPDGTHKQSRRKSSAEVVGVNLTLSADGLSIATINQELSPHPPKPKRRELESTTHHSGSSSCSSVVDPQSDQDLPNNNQYATPPVDHDIHEMQRSAERLAPFQRGPNLRTRRTSSRSSRFRKSQSFESDDDTPAGSADEKQWKRSQNGQWKTRDSGADFDSPMDTRAPGDENQEASRATTDRHNGVLKAHAKKNHRSLDRKDSEGKASHPLGELPPDDQLLYGSVSRRESLDDQEDWKAESFASFDGDDASIPHLDLNTLHEHGDGEEPIPSEHRFSWPLTKPPQDDTALLSPSAPYMRKANSYEAPQSPSAFKNYFSHRSSLQFDPSLPPSPPVEQDDLLKSTMKEDEAVAVNVKQLTKKMHSYKKKIKLFEEAFELEHGYRPSHAEKMNYPEAKKMLQEFNKIRKELRQLKEEGHTGELMSPHKEYPTMKTQRLGDGEISKPSVASSLTKAQQYLCENRRIHQRPQEFEKMTRDQVQDEKVAIQKALLQFESVHGRPVTKIDRDTMRELYERYRSVKRLVRANSLQSGGSSITSGATMKGKELVMMGTELQPILEHVAMDFTSPQHRRLPDENAKFSEASEDQENIAEENLPCEEEPQGEITKDELVKSSIAAGRSDTDEKKCDQKSCNLHELPLSELLRQLQQARIEKRRLKKSVREFEDDFQRKTGRRAQKEDRSSVERIYADYKHIKARLKLLDALVTKHEHHMMI